jgi:hypothetical protein
LRLGLISCYLLAMTPATRQGVWSASALLIPTRVTVSAERLSWSSFRSKDDHGWPGSEGLLEAFTGLAVAEPAEMAAFMETYGVPELCGKHGLPDRHVGGYCAIGGADEKHYVNPSAIRRVARAFLAAQSLANALSVRRIGEVQDWVDLQWTIKRSLFHPDNRDWPTGRVRLAHWLTCLLRDCGVAPLARWDGARLHVTSEAGGLLGVLAVLLSRELGQGDVYTCDVCGAPVTPTRPPREGEGVYCRAADNAACRREQQRRNQAAWRARKREEADQ